MMNCIWLSWSDYCVVTFYSILLIFLSLSLSLSFSLDVCLSLYLCLSLHPCIFADQDVVLFYLIFPILSCLVLFTFFSRPFGCGFSSELWLDIFFSFYMKEIPCSCHAAMIVCLISHSPITYLLSLSLSFSSSLSSSFFFAIIFCVMWYDVMWFFFVDFIFIMSCISFWSWVTGCTLTRGRIVLWWLKWLRSYAGE